VEKWRRRQETEDRRQKEKKEYWNSGTFSFAKASVFAKATPDRPEDRME